MQTTRDDVYAMQSQLGDRQSGVGIEPLIFELETEEANPLAIMAKELWLLIQFLVAANYSMSQRHQSVRA